MPPPTIVGGEHYVFGLSVCLSVRCSTVRCPFSTYSREAISVHTVGISVKLDTDIHHVSGPSSKGFKVMESKVKVRQRRP